MIHFFFGENAYSKQVALQQLVTHAKKRYGEEAVERYESEQLDPAKLAEVLQGASLFSTEKMVVIRSASSQKLLWAALEPWVEALPEGTELVLVETAPDRRTRTFKQLQKHAHIQEFKPLSEDQAVQWLTSEATLRGGKLSATQARRVIARTGSDQGRLSNELDKLLVQETINDQTIDALIEQTMQANIYALLDACLHKKADSIGRLLAAAKLSEDPYQLFGLLSSQLGQLAALVYADGRLVDEIARSLGSHPFSLRKLQALAAKTSQAELADIIKIAARLDMNLKSTGLDPWLLLEQALVKIATRSKTS